MSDGLNLSLPERGKKPSGSRVGSWVLLVLVLAIGAANLFATLRARREGPPEPKPQLFSPQAQEALALKLEKQSLNESAIRAWREYLDSAQLDDPKRAKLWYRIGRLHQDSGDYEKALDAFYRSEGVAVLDELSGEIGRRSQECLEALGKFTALRYELAARVGVKEGADASGDEVVAEIGQQKITRAELDRRIEAQIELQMTQFGSYLPPDQLQRQKKTLLKRFSSNAARLQFLNQLIIEEILYRKAREDKLYEEAATRDLLNDADRKILAQTVLQKELARNINITESDLKLYYEANKETYREPEGAEVSQILVEDESAAGAVLKRLQAGEAFEDLAKELSRDKATAAEGGKISGWIDKGSPIPGIGQSDEATAAIFSTDAGKVAETPVKRDRGYCVFKVRSRRKERLKPFDEVRESVFRELRAKKEQEVQQNLVEALKTRYNVVIHQSQFVSEPSAADAPN